MMKFYSRPYRIKTRYVSIIALWGVIVFFNSCTTSNCILCELDNSTLYNVELKNNVGTLGKSDFQSYFPPVLLERKKNKQELYVIDCDNTNPYLLEGVELESFIKENVKIIKPEQVEKITTTSDVDVPPANYTPKPPEAKLACIRYRNAVKFETRAMVGFRPWFLAEGDGSITYPGVNQSTTYNRKITSLQSIGKPNASILSVGLEAAALPRIFRINNRHSFNVGPMVGIWPIDGGLYIPLAIHPRLTFDDITSPIWGTCDAFYAYGDIGTAYDALGKIPFTKEYGQLSSYFAGLGFGMDMWKKRGMDLSFDIGYRYSNLALPANQDYVDCLKENNVRNNDLTPSRIAHQLVIRVGYTW